MGEKMTIRIKATKKIVYWECPNCYALCNSDDDTHDINDEIIEVSCSSYIDAGQSASQKCGCKYEVES